jgi:hypothetical protein
MITLALGILDDKEGSAILDGSTRVHELGLGIDVASGLLAEFVQADLLSKEGWHSQKAV